VNAILNATMEIAKSWSGFPWRSGPLVMCLFVVMVTAGCAARPLEVGREPELSPVGAGLRRASNPDPQVSAEHLFPEKGREFARADTVWRERGGDLFRDPRARRIGDILTVTISMKDKANLDNSSKRSRDSSHGFGLDISHAVDWKGFTSAGTAKADSSLKSNTATDGKGEIARSENIELRVAAIVTDILPNGNLVIEGSQEIRVNFELRVLTFTGIVSPVDIKADNTISHERIAEARMSYGGRGRMMEVQQPAWGHQVIDLLFPF
jgi:flagellar L-ring protein precursor FlgH